MGKITTLEIEQLENGYVVGGYESSGNDIYGERVRTVAANKAEVKEFVNQWLEGDAPPFTTE